LADLIFGGPIARDEIPHVCERARALLEGCEADPVVCDVDALDPDAVALDVLARVQLTARRLGRRVELAGVNVELRDLLELAGLSEVLPLVAGSNLEPRGQPEEREQALRVEEEADPGDRAV
jgi:ABC-type transporter Mla MlaB component